MPQRDGPHHPDRAAGFRDLRGRITCTITIKRGPKPIIQSPSPGVISSRRSMTPSTSSEARRVVRDPRQHHAHRQDEQKVRTGVPQLLQEEQPRQDRRRKIAASGAMMVFAASTTASRLPRRWPALISPRRPMALPPHIIAGRAFAARQMDAEAPSKPWASDTATIGVRAAWPPSKAFKAGWSPARGPSQQMQAVPTVAQGMLGRHIQARSPRTPPGRPGARPPPDRILDRVRPRGGGAERPRPTP